ncbi:MAG: hypothetical protein K2V38_07700, partial [Gemmataceae bacterium]|nr:hypothetical protein [Gemmataceae bacterium]
MVRAGLLVSLAGAVVGVGVGSLVAAPVPPPTEKQLLAELWGATDGPADFALVGRQLRIRAATLPTPWFLSGGRMNAPRTARAVAGDFEVTLKVAD